MGGAKRQGALHEIIGQVGCIHKSVLDSAQHSLAPHLHARNDLAHDLDASFDRVDRVEEGNFIFLQIAVIGKRQTFHNCQQRLQMAEYASGLAANQLGHVGIFFLRHHRAARAVTVRQLNEAKFLARP